MLARRSRGRVDTHLENATSRTGGSAPRLLPQPPRVQEPANMNRFSMLKLIHSIGVIAAALAVTLVAPAPAACAARTSASAKALVKLDDEWSRAAATKDV